MKPRHKAFAAALSHGQALPEAEAPAEEGAAPGGGGADTAAPLFDGGASTSAAAGLAPGGSLQRGRQSAKRERKVGTGSRGPAAAGGHLPQQVAFAAAVAPPSDEPSAETKRRFRGVYWHVLHSCIAAVPSDAPRC